MSPRYAARLEQTRMESEAEPPTASWRFRVVVILVVMFMGALLSVSVTGAMIGARQNEQAALDTFSYVGDITAERVARYANGARDIVVSTVVSLERDGPERSREDLADEMYARLLREPEVRAIYVGFPDGSFLGIRRSASGFIERYVTAGPDPVMTDTVRDSFFRPFSTEVIDAEFDPRTRPWYVTGLSSRRLTWTDPYISFETQTTAASAVQPAYRDGQLYAVVGADLTMDALSGILDELPVGPGAEAFVMSMSREVIAAPSDYLDAMAAIIDATGRVPRADELGLSAEASVDQHTASEVFAEVDGRYVMERGFLPAEGLDWVLHLEADEAQLSPALARMQLTLAWVTWISAILVILGSFLLYRLWRPLEQLRIRATTDSLTGLSNRHDLERRGSRLLISAHRNHDTVVVATVDLDNFKAMNDAYGHHMGDRALAVVGQTLLENVRERDVAARIGGDEFVLIMRVGIGERASMVVERIRAVVSQELTDRVVGGDTVGVTAGFTVTDTYFRDLAALLREADGALVHGKRQQKESTYVWDRMDGKHPEV